MKKLITLFVLVILTLFLLGCTQLGFEAIGQIKQYESIGVSCQTNLDCENALKNSGGINNINFRCNNNICEIEKIDPIKMRPKR